MLYIFRAFAMLLLYILQNKERILTNVVCILNLFYKSEEYNPTKHGICRSLTTESWCNNSNLQVLLFIFKYVLSLDPTSCAFYSSPKMLPSFKISL